MMNFIDLIINHLDLIQLINNTKPQVLYLYLLFVI